MVAFIAALSASQIDARNHVSNCLTDEQYEWHEKHLSLSCFIKANEESGLIDYYQLPNTASLNPQGRGPWIQVHATQIVIEDGDQFLVGTASDYNGNTASQRVKQADGSIVFQEVSYFLATDAQCTLKPVGFLSPSEELNPAELCRIKNG